MIDEAIKHLSDSNINTGAEALVDIAHVFAKAGMPKQTFMDIRQYIIKEAIAKTDPLFIQEKLKIAEQKLQEIRCGNTKTIITN